jgi:hypothetical protein
MAVFPFVTTHAPECAEVERNSSNLLAHMLRVRLFSDRRLDRGLGPIAIKKWSCDRAIA